MGLIDWTTSDGTRPSLSCARCGHRTPMLKNGLGFDCCAPPEDKSRGLLPSPPARKDWGRVALRWFWTPRDCRIDRYLGFIALTMVTGMVAMVAIVSAMGGR